MSRDIRFSLCVLQNPSTRAVSCKDGLDARLFAKPKKENHRTEKNGHTLQANARSDERLIGGRTARDRAHHRRGRVGHLKRLAPRPPQQRAAASAPRWASPAPTVSPTSTGEDGAKTRDPSARYAVAPASPQVMTHALPHARAMTSPAASSVPAPVNCNASRSFRCHTGDNALMRSCLRASTPMMRGPGA